MKRKTKKTIEKIITCFALVVLLSVLSFVCTVVVTPCIDEPSLIYALVVLATTIGSIFWLDEHIK